MEKKNVINVGSKIFVSNRYLLEENYKETIAAYKAEAELIDFSNSVDATQRINSWVYHVTNGNIENFVQPGKFNFAMINVLHNNNFVCF